MAPTIANSELAELEMDLLLEALFRRYGFDFRDYARASLSRRVQSRLQPEGVATISGLLEKTLHEPKCMDRLLLSLTIHTTSMFRDPGFYRSFREQVVPLLRTYPFARIWHAGCSSGEEVHSLAIVLEEEGLLERCRIYATDISEVVLDRARHGVFPLSAMREYTSNYLEAGGTREFSAYYVAEHDHAIFRPSLREHVIFAPHNLVTDASFNEFHVILCRNVTIYFNRKLQERVHSLFYQSLGRLGVLGLGLKETLRFTPHETCYEEIDGQRHIYKKVR